jgi:hypothetical protein
VLQPPLVAEVVKTGLVQVPPGAGAGSGAGAEVAVLLGVGLAVLGFGVEERLAAGVATGTDAAAVDVATRAALDDLPAVFEGTAADGGGSATPVCAVGGAGDPLASRALSGSVCEAPLDVSCRIQKPMPAAPAPTASTNPITMPRRGADELR